MNRSRVSKPQMYNFFERQQAQPDPAPLELTHLIIAPHRQVFDAFDATAAPRDAALLGTYRFADGSWATLARATEGDPGVQFELPDASPGLVLESASVYAEFGVGASRSLIALRPPSGESIVAENNEGSATLAPSGTLGVYRLTDPSTNLYRTISRLTGVVYPTTNAQLSDGAWLLVRLSGVFGGPFYVRAAPSSSSPYMVEVKPLGYSPITATTSVSYQLIQFPREFDIASGPLAARAEIAGSAATSKEHQLVLTKPGTYEFTILGGRRAFLELQMYAGGGGGVADEDTIDLINAAGDPISVVFDLDTSGAAGDLVPLITTGMTASQVATAFCTAINAGSHFWAVKNPTNAAYVRVWQRTAGVAGNTEATQTTAAVDFFAISQMNEDEDAAVFIGGAAALAGGETFTFKNLTSQPVRLTFEAPTGSNLTTRDVPTWVSTDGEWVAGIKPLDLLAYSVWDFNYDMSQNTNGVVTPVYIEPSSVPGWDSGSSGPPLSLAQAIFSGANLSGVTFTVGEPAGELVIPAAEFKAIPLAHRLVGSFPASAENTITISGGSATAATNNGDATVDLVVEIEAGTGIPVGRAAGDTGTHMVDVLLAAINEALLDHYQSDLGLEHAVESTLYLAPHPSDLGFVTDADTDWHQLSSLATHGLVTSHAATGRPEFVRRSTATYPTSASMTLTPVPLLWIAEVAYRTPGVGGNELLFSIVWDNNGGARTLTVESLPGEVRVTLPSNRALATGTNLDDIALALDELDEAGEYLHQVYISRVWSTATGAAILPVDDDYSGWAALAVAPFCAAEILDYTTTDDIDRTRKGYSGLNVALGDGSAAPVVRIHHTLRGVGSIGDIALYAGYIGLRTDTSALATMASHGRRPNPIRVRNLTEDLELLVGDLTLANPLGLAVKEYFSVTGAGTVYILGIDEVTEADPWGTTEALARALALAKRRKTYHHHIINSSDWVVPQVVAFAEALGGSQTVSMSRGMYFYVPVLIPEIAPDSRIGEGSQVELVSEGSGNTIVRTNLDVIAAGVEVGDILVSTLYPQAEEAAFVLQDGRRGFKVMAVDAANPTRMTLRGTSLPAAIFSTPTVAKPFEVIRKGLSLSPGGVFDAEAATAALVAHHTQAGYTSPRVQKIIVNGADSPVGGVYQTLPGAYMVATYGGLVASRLVHLPTSTLSLPSTLRNLDGVSGRFDDDQLERLCGAGLTMLVQDSDTGAVTIYRDVSSDTSTRTFQRRGARITEDLFVIRLNAQIVPRLGPNLINDLAINMISADVDGVVSQMLGASMFRELRVESITVIDDAIRSRYGIDDTGVLVVYRYTHLEEMAALINHHIVESV